MPFDIQHRISIYARKCEECVAADRLQSGGPGFVWLFFFRIRWWRTQYPAVQAQALWRSGSGGVAFLDLCYGTLGAIIIF
jgi:hypothetical protein